jgi:hypothetical protein
MMEGSGSVQSVTDPDQGGPKASGSGSTTLLAKPVTAYNVTVTYNCLYKAKAYG